IYTLSLYDALPICSRASCRARALMTVPSIPMVSEVARSMPAPAPVVPLQMFPPPTITANSRSNSDRVWAISKARRSTTGASMVSSEAEEASASPDIFNTMRRRSPTVASVADDDLGELRHRGRAEELGDGLLLILHIRLIEEHPLLVPATQPAFHDLGQRSIGFAFVTGNLLDRLALCRHLIRQNVIPRDVAGPGECDVGSDVVCQLWCSAFERHSHGIDPAAGLQ